MKKLVLLLITFIGMSSIQAQSPLCTYLFDGNGNDAIDTNHLHLNNVSYTNDYEGRSGYAALFNGTNSWAEVPGVVLSSTFYEFRLSLWFKTAHHQKGGGLAFAGAQTVGTYVSNYTPLLYIDTFGKLNTFLYDGSAVPLTSMDTVNDDHWHHALVSYSINSMSGALTQQLFLDGNSVAFRTGYISGTPSYSHYYIGACCARGIGDVTDNWMYFDGAIDEVNTFTSNLSYGTWENLLFKLTDKPISQAIDSGGALNLRIHYTNFLGQPRTFVWKKDGAVLSAFTGDSLQIPACMYTDSGNYTVEVTNDYLKTLSSQTAIIHVVDTSGVIVPTGIENIAAQSIQVFPNPASDHIRVQSANTLGIEIFSVEGEKLTVAKTNERINLQSYTPGLYFIHIINQSGESIAVTKFIKE